MSDATVTVRCVICDHTWTVPLTSEMPMCPQCMGPVVVTNAKVKK